MNAVNFKIIIMTVYKTNSQIWLKLCKFLSLPLKLAKKPHPGMYKSMIQE